LVRIQWHAHAGAQLRQDALELLLAVLSRDISLSRDPSTREFMGQRRRSQSGTTAVRRRFTPCRFRARGPAGLRRHERDWAYPAMVPTPVRLGHAASATASRSRRLAAFERYSATEHLPNGSYGGHKQRLRVLSAAAVLRDEELPYASNSPSTS
jgi:hypothetical protein